MSQVPTNFFGGSPLNRLSWLRTSPIFLNSVVDLPATRWVVLQAGRPLFAGEPSAKQRSLARFTTSDIKPLLGPKPYFGQGQHPGESAPAGVPVLEAARFSTPKIVFLGFHEPKGFACALPSTEFSAKSESPEVVAARIQGTPYFSVDISEFESTEVERLLQRGVETNKGLPLSFEDPRVALVSFDAFDAAVLAMTRSMVDWNERHKFCPSCGAPVFSSWGGWKLSCSSQLPWAEKEGQRPCATEKGIHNFAHPRTDPVVIMLIVNEQGDKVLMGRNKKWPEKFYSALAGFMEPGETFEDSVKREVREEAAIDVWDVEYHSTQPWPFPASLMVGFYAKASDSQPIRVDLDNELSDARWFTRDEILAVTSGGPSFTEKDYKRLNEVMEGKATNEAAESDIAKKKKQKDDHPLRLPESTAIAGVLIRDWARGKTASSSNL